MTRFFGAWLGLTQQLALALVLAGCTPQRGIPAVSAPTSASQAGVAWQRFDPEAFAQARRQRRLILLSVQANFCHWCHVMNATTYRDPRVVAVLREHFVVIRVDESERPDLATRYADWGWPATAILSPEAEPVVTLRGHRPAAPFAALLEQLVAQLDAGQPLAVSTSVGPDSGALDADLGRAQERALAQLDALYDAREGGWGGPQKYPFPAPVEHALERAFVRGEPERMTRALTTLHGHEQLIDAVAGGMFQYSLEGVWTQPHYEKLASIQAGALQNFAEAYRATGDARWLRAAGQVASYVLGSLRTPEGSFASSQNADVGELGSAGYVEGARYYAQDLGGRAQGRAPTLDTQVYANLNGLLIQGLCAYERASAERSALVAAQAALTALTASHARGAAFAHAADDRSGRFYLSDQVEMIGALWQLSDALREPTLRERAYAGMDFVLAKLQDREQGGFYAQTPDPAAVGVFARTEKPAADNARFARLLLRRARLSHDPGLLETVQRTLATLTDPASLAKQGRKVADVLLALEEANGDYVMFSIVGHAADPRTQALVEAAYRAYVPHGLVRVDEPGQGLYPYPGEPAVYLCSASACSAEVTDSAALSAALAVFVKNAREN
jgi:uncharacterized protein YyaL (SSP411 family)